ncbi:MAG TPA: DNA mismatch repair protein MutS [Candidatus Enterousia avicola]|uniref:DNA mismatch repair protein MutS n=1 Tax=Candidatus Enterousia avicola TaxID=2840787 RepID=A0A9D1SML4_9PROT|nr:DNA mismatch repair protein MutS [Candidatus Enterousia avicola]
MAEKSKLTPVMQQYVSMKEENPDALLMFRLGDFYEAFFDDAKIISKNLGLVLTQRGTDADGEDIPMCGIPWHAADNYFGRLVRAGFRVALVEQMETPAEAKARGHKFIDRKIIRVLTPGTLTDENLLTPKNSNFLISVVILDDGLFDIAGCDISTGEFFVGKTADVFDDLVRINPAEVIYPESLAENETIMHLRDTFKTTPVYEKLYHRADIDTVVSSVFGGAVGHNENVDSEDSAIKLLAGYLFNTQRGAAITFRAPYVYKNGKQLLIDSATWKSLEIDAPINDGGVCLTDVLDNTKTAAGARKLRSYLRTLSGDINEIKRRQGHIGHLLLNPKIMGAVSVTLGSIPDVGRSLSRLLSGRGTPRDMRHVADFLIELPNAKMLGSRLDDDLKNKFSNIDTHDALAAELNSALSDELPTFFRDGNVIRSGFDMSLDHMRGLAHGAKETIAGMQAEYATSTGIHNLKIKYNNILGYFIEVPSTKADILMKPEAGFIHRQTLAGNMRFTTARLIDLDNDVRSAAEKSAAMESEIVSSFIEKIRQVSDDLLSSAELLADLDVWYSLAVVADKYSWVRPDITDEVTFDIIGGRHPVIDFVLRSRGDNFVKNDCNLNIKSVALLTGPNMAGKSTYLRQNALLVVLAHLGSFVPAVNATIGICDQLFSRVGASDNLAAGQSTFMVEMSETANILRRATRASFIIFDEIGRGTSTYDGMAIAQAVLEYLNQLQPRTLFATHYHELTALVGCNPGQLENVSCLTIDVREHNNEIIFMHKIVPGVANRSYGIQVAKMAGMPASVVARAEEVLVGLEAHNETLCNDVAHVSNEKENSKDKRGEDKVAQSKNTRVQLNLFG